MWYAGLVQGLETELVNVQARHVAVVRMANHRLCCSHSASC